MRDWKVALAQADLKNYLKDEPAPTKINYRPFDFRYTYYTAKMRGFFGDPRKKVMQHFLLGENIGLVLCRQFKSGQNYAHSFITKRLIESSYISNKTSEINYVFPLYHYPTAEQPDDLKETRKPNLNETIVNEIAEKINLKFTPEAENNQTSFCPLDLLDYIYAILHSLSYRKNTKNF